MTDNFENTKREELINLISDTYKELNGIRPRFYNWDAMTEEDLEAEYSELSNQVLRRILEQRNEEREHQAAVAKAMTPVSLANPALSGLGLSRDQGVLLCSIIENERQNWDSHESAVVEMMCGEPRLDNQE